MTGLDLGALLGILSVVGVVVGALWRVGTIGRTIGEAMTRLSTQVSALEQKVSRLELAESARTADELATLRRELAEARAHPHRLTDPPRRPPGGLP